MSLNTKFCVVLLFISAYAYYMHFKNVASEFEVEVLSQNKTYKKPVDSNQLKVKGILGFTTVEWTGDGVKITDSCCPNKTCVQFGKTNNSSLICVPNGIIVKPTKDLYDAITQ